MKNVCLVANTELFNPFELSLCVLIITTVAALISSREVFSWRGAKRFSQGVIDKRPSNMATLQVGILIVSDTAAQNAASDKTTDILTEVFVSSTKTANCAGAERGVQWNVAKTEIVADDTLEVQRVVRSWTGSEDGLNLVLTSGGTGFATKDITPEVN
jgi:hypothetical protein